MKGINFTKYIKKWLIFSFCWPGLLKKFSSSIACCVPVWSHSRWVSGSTQPSLSWIVTRTIERNRGTMRGYKRSAALWSRSESCRSWNIRPWGSERPFGRRSLRQHMQWQGTATTMTRSQHMDRSTSRWNKGRSQWALRQWGLSGWYRLEAKVSFSRSRTLACVVT